MGLSIGYMTVKSEPDREQPMVRHLKELKMFEYSIVTFPMNTSALITSAKSLGQLDRVNLLLKHLDESGVSRKDLELAPRKEAADVNLDPLKIEQSIDNLINLFKN